MGSDNPSMDTPVEGSTIASAPLSPAFGALRQELAARLPRLPGSNRMSPTEAVIWRVGHDPALRTTVATLVLLAHEPERDQLLARLDAGVRNAPRLRWLPDDPARIQSRPNWLLEEPTDVSVHLRTIAVPEAGGLPAVLDLVELLEHHPFHPARSPWDVTLIRGLPDGRAAVYLRADHVLTDGIGGSALMELMFDDGAPVVERELPADEEVDLAQPPRRRPGTFTVTLDLTKAARPVAAAVIGGLDAVRRASPLDAVLQGMQRGLDAVSSLSRQLLVPGGPRSLLADGNAPSSHFRLFSVPQARRVALALGGSRNDLLVAATAAGLGKYHEKLGVPCQELRLAMPATQHREHEPGGNWFSLARVDVPTSDAHPGPYFGVVAERLAAARREPALQLTGAVAAALHRLPGRVLVPGVGAQIGSVDFVATTIPGYRRGRHLGGGEVEGVYPFGPRLGRLANVVGAGNEDRLDVGVALDPFAVEDPDLLVQCIVSAFDDLTRAAGLAPAPVRSSEGSPAA